MTLYKAILSSKEATDYWPTGSITEGDRYFKTKEEVKNYFLNKKVEYYKHKQKFSKALENKQVDLEGLRAFEGIFGKEITSGEIKPYYYDLVGIMAVEVEEV